MTAIELNAMRGELAREILNTDNMNVLVKVQRYLKRVLKAEEKEEYIEKEELLNQIREGLIEVRDANRNGVKLKSAEELLNEL